MRVYYDVFLLLSLHLGAEFLAWRELYGLPRRNNHRLSCGRVAALALLVVRELEGAKALYGDGIAAYEAVRDGRKDGVQHLGCIDLGEAGLPCHLLDKF